MLRQRFLGARLLESRLLDPWLFDTWLFDTRLFRANRFHSLMFHDRRWSCFGAWLAMRLMGLRFRLGFALHLQAMFFQLLSVDRLLAV